MGFVIEVAASTKVLVERIGGDLNFDPLRFSRAAVMMLKPTERDARLREMEVLANAKLEGARSLQEFQHVLQILIEEELVARLGYDLGRWEYDSEVEAWGDRSSYMDPVLRSELVLRSEYPEGLQLAWGEWPWK